MKAKTLENHQLLTNLNEAVNGQVPVQILISKIE